MKLAIGTISAILLSQLPVILLSQLSSAKSENVIGVIRDTNGNVVEQINVAARLQGKSDNSATAMTDAQGQFHLTLPPGVYELFASDEARLYPDCRITLFDCAGKSVTVKPGDVLAPITLTVRQAAYISGIVTDTKGTGAIEKAYVVVRRADNYYRDSRAEIASTFKIMVPAETGLTMIVAARKYRLWTYREISSGEATFHVARRDEVKLKISMVRVEK